MGEHFCRHVLGSRRCGVSFAASEVLVIELRANTGPGYRLYSHSKGGVLWMAQLDNTDFERRIRERETENALLGERAEIQVEAVPAAAVLPARPRERSWA